MPLIAARHQLVIAFEPDGLAVALWRKTLLGWKIVATAKPAGAEGEGAADSPFAPLRAQLAQWGVAKGTAALIVPHAATGGFIDFPVPKRRPADFSAWVETELSQHLPFSAREVAWSWQAVPSGKGKTLRVVWMPKAWVKEHEIELARIGLALKEIMPRALVTACRWDATRGERGQWALCERVAGEIALHVFVGRVPRRSLRLVQADVALAARRAGAELLAAWDPTQGGGRLYCAEMADATARELAAVPGVETVAARPQRDWHAAVLRAWQSGEEGVWLPPEPSEIFRGIRRATLFILLTGVTLIGLTMWQVQETRKQIGALETEVRKDKPKFQKVVATEVQLVATTRKVARLAELRDAVNPLDPLDDVRKALPDGAWLTRADIRGAEVWIEGHGAKAGEVLARIEQSSAFSGSKIVDQPADAAAGGERFSVTMRWRGPAPGMGPR